MRFAAVDIGTNSVLLLIVEKSNGALAPLVDRATITRLGEGVDRTRELAPSAHRRTLGCLEEYAGELARHAPVRLAVVGTSALRDARGGPEFSREVERLLGSAPDVISGRREAELAFRGALSGLGVAGDLTVVDVGGGSTEIVAGSRTADGVTIEAAESLDIGSVRLFERHVRSDPPSALELAAVERDVERALANAPASARRETLIGVAGTVTTLAALRDEIDPYDGARIHGVRLPLTELASLRARLATLSLAEKKTLRGLDPRRADVIVAGSLIVERVVAWARASELIVSDRGVRWGLVEELATAAS